jgi:copper(I)-binding protein
MKILDPIRPAALAAFFAVSLPGAALAHDHVLIKDGFIRSAPPTAPTAAGYAVIENHRDVPVHITGVSADVAAKVELHTTRQGSDGVMRMIHLSEGITIPAGGSHALQPGQDHVMFMGLKSPLEQGASVPVTFHFDGLSDLTVDLTVDHQGSGHGGHGAHGMK